MSTWKITTRAMIAASLFFFSGLMTFAALGLVPAMQSDTPVLAFCVTTPFAAVMFGVGVSIFRELIRASGIAEGILRRQFAALLMKRPTLWSAFASVTPLLLAAQFWETEDGFLLKLAGVTEAMLIDTMRIEFLLIHGFPFLIFWVLFSINKTGTLRIAGGAIFLLVAGLYTGAAVNIDGSFNGALIFLYLLIPDLISFARNDPKEYVRPRLAMRWCLQFLGMSFALIASQSEFLQNSATFLAGLLFFSWIALMEFFRLADIPLEVADACNRAGSTWKTA